jgi:hypothetical protein
LGYSAPSHYAAKSSETLHVPAGANAQATYTGLRQKPLKYPPSLPPAPLSYAKVGRPAQHLATALFASTYIILIACFSHFCSILLQSYTATKMKSVQRKFGTFMKRSDNEKDVQTVLEEFKAVDDMLERVRQASKSWFVRGTGILTVRTAD